MQFEQCSGIIMTLYFSFSRQSILWTVRMTLKNFVSVITFNEAGKHLRSQPKEHWRFNVTEQQKGVIISGRASSKIRYAGFSMWSDTKKWKCLPLGSMVPPTDPIVFDRLHRVSCLLHMEDWNVRMKRLKWQEFWATLGLFNILVGVSELSWLSDRPGQRTRVKHN